MLFTPAGKPETVAPVAPPPTANVIFVIELFMQTVCASVPEGEERDRVEFGFTVIDPLREVLLQGPEVDIV